MNEWMNECNMFRLLYKKGALNYYEQKNKEQKSASLLIIAEQIKYKHSLSLPPLSTSPYSYSPLMEKKD
jgi:hypothetical protein